MEHGYLILSILALLFISMYGYSYIPVVLEKRKEKRLIIEQAKLEELKRQEKIKKQENRNEELNKLLRRSAEIRKELQLLEQMKTNRKGFRQDDINQMKVEEMRKQHAG